MAPLLMFLLASAWKLSASQQSGGPILKYYACASVGYSDNFYFACPHPAQLITVKSALIGYSNQYNGQTQPPSCPWSSVTSAACDVIGFPQCASWLNQCSSPCNCTSVTDVPAIVCNNRTSCSLDQTFLSAPPGTPGLCLLSSNANFISINYTCTFRKFFDPRTLHWNDNVLQIVYVHSKPRAYVKRSNNSDNLAFPVSVTVNL
jgi:hypothetical protein